MPPRRSVARSAATPARSTRGTSAVAVDGSVSRKVTRGSAQQAGVSEDVVNNPQLPELQTQQSYAYGSTKTPLLPEQLVAREKMSLKEMAETIDAGVRQADKHFEEHVAETQGNLGTTPQPERNRRTRSGSNEVSREPLKAGSKLERQKKDMVAAWADSIESSQLDDVEDEALSPPSTPDDATRKDTDPSSFPSGIYDHSYNYERAIRRPQQHPKRESRLGQTFHNFWNVAARYWNDSYYKLEGILIDVAGWFSRLFHAVRRTLLALPDSSMLSTITRAALGLLLACAASLLFCSLYTNYLCDVTSNSVISLNLQKLCGSCNAPFSSLNLSGSELHNVAKLSAALNNLNKQIRASETRLMERVDSKYSHLQSEIDTLRRQQSEITTHLAHLSNDNQQSLSSSSIASPLIPKINFFAPSNGAIINPHLTSPTRQKPFPLPQRVLMRMLGLSKHQSKPPITALEPWHDVGDCWCGSDAPAPSGRLQEQKQDSVRLAVTVRELIYPFELVIEHYPAAGSLTPDTAPKQVELWADFAHLDEEEFAKQSARQVAEGVTALVGLGPTYVRIGKAEYDASRGAGHVQAFRLDVNQDGKGGAGLLHYAQHFVVRVTENYGAEHTCLYRIRLHGVPAADQEDANTNSK